MNTESAVRVEGCLGPHAKTAKPRQISAPGQTGKQSGICRGESRGSLRRRTQGQNARAPAGFSGIGLAALFYLVKTDIPVILAQKFNAAYKVLWNKYYVDELYSLIIVRPAIWTAKNILMGITDARIIEAIVNGVPKGIGEFSRILRKVQTGLLQHYAAIMALGVLIIMAVMLLR